MKFKASSVFGAVALSLLFLCGSLQALTLDADGIPITDDYFHQNVYTCGYSFAPWQFTSWGINKGQISVYASTYGLPGLAIFGSSNENESIKANFFNGTFGPDGWQGLAACIQKGNGFDGEWQGSQAIVARYNNGCVEILDCIPYFQSNWGTVLSSANVAPVASGAAYTLRLDVSNGSKVIVSLNGVPVLNYVRPVALHGPLAIVAANGWYAVNNVSFIGSTTPSVARLSPASVQAGSLGGFLWLYGSNFTNTDVVSVSGQNRSTTYISPTILKVELIPDDIACAKNCSILVADGNTVSSECTFPVVVSVGNQGPKGDVGPQGPAGPQGVAGPAGSDGSMGVAGPQGDVGPAGPHGIAGLNGKNGERGDTGPKGDKGDKGDTGPKGEKGDSGPAGPKGDKGDSGDKGDTGDKGDKGDPYSKPKTKPKTTIKNK